MVDHTATEHHDPGLAFPGHNSLVAYVLETQEFGLHCEDCGWFGGGFEGRWAETQMTKAWAKHKKFVERGGTVEHGHPLCWPGEICLCPRCRQAARET